MNEAIKHKQVLLEQLVGHLTAELETLCNSQRTAQDGATHEESRAENSKDTRATEQTYLARGLATRVTQIEAALTALKSMKLRVFNSDKPISVSAVVGLKDDGGNTSRFFIAPVGGGTQLAWKSKSVRVITPASPMGQALIGKLEGDEATLRGPSGNRELIIVTVS